MPLCGRLPERQGAGRRRIPFPHHAKQNGGCEHREPEPSLVRRCHRRCPEGKRSPITKRPKVCTVSNIARPLWHTITDFSALVLPHGQAAQIRRSNSRALRQGGCHSGIRRVGRGFSSAPRGPSGAYRTAQATGGQRSGAARSSRRENPAPLEPHDVVTAVHVNHLAGDSRTRIRRQKHSCIANFPDIDISLQGSSLGMRLEHISQA